VDHNFGFLPNVSKQEMNQGSKARFHKVNQRQKECILVSSEWPSSLVTLGALQV